MVHTFRFYYRESLYCITFLDRILFARKGGEDGAIASTCLGGDVISMEDASVSKRKKWSQTKHEFCRC